MHIRKKKIYLLASILVVYVTLVATHKGEFWPFSIFPMYSQAGHPWTKTLVRDVSGLDRDSLKKEYHQISKLPGKPFALKTAGINKNDLSNFVSKTKVWQAKEITELRSFFEPLLKRRKLLIYEIDARLNGQNVEVRCIPFVLLQADSSDFINSHPTKE